jgi:nitroimidazol reductase NimA-like FMN-containing flavoprotein (pyridoxamine 5'-phosphate oxidase superfamily)
MTETDRNGLEVLDRETCLRLLGSARLGRIGLTSGALPLILPVNFCLVDEEIFFRTGVGTKLDAATRGTVVAFEVDDHDALSHTGWSVVVTGRARDVGAEEVKQRLQDHPLPRWVPGADGRTVAVSTELMSGRRIRDVRPEADI